MARNKLFKVRASDGVAVSLVEEAGHYPIWSPDGRFILYRRTDTPVIKAITPEGASFPIGLTNLQFRNAVSHPYRFMPDSNQLVVLSGTYRQENFLLADLHTGEKRQLTDLTPGYSITTFDVSPDGKRIIFDRVRQNADIVMIEPRP